MGQHDNEAKTKLGEDAWSILQEHASKGGIGVQEIKDIATLLGATNGGKVLGQHLTRMELAGTNVNIEAEVRDVLGDWYHEEMFDMNQSVALAKLIDILDNPSVNLKPCAKQLRSCSFAREVTHDAMPEASVGLKRLVLLGQTGSVSFGQLSPCQGPWPKHNPNVQRK